MITSRSRAVYPSQAGQWCTSMPEIAGFADHYGIGRDGATQDVGAQARAERECLRVLDFNG